MVKSTVYDTASWNTESYVLGALKETDQIATTKETQEGKSNLHNDSKGYVNKKV